MIIYHNTNKHEALRLPASCHTGVVSYFSVSISLICKRIKTYCKGPLSFGSALALYMCSAQVFSALQDYLSKIHITFKVEFNTNLFIIVGNMYVGIKNKTLF